MPVTTEMSEPSSLHSVKLVSLARSLSGLGFDAINGGPITPPDNDEPPLPESGIDLGPGLFFADGKRKVDYILCYKYKKRRGSKGRLSIASNGSIPIQIKGRWEVEAESGEAGAPAGEVEEPKLSDEEKALMREEFEAGLLEAGLQIERDKERSNGMRCIRLHIPWLILSREAELQKIKVAVKKKCELRKRTGIAGIWDSIVTKVNTPFQPDVPNFDIYKDSQTHVHFKTLKHPFIRDKLHLYDIKSTETVFDNATRSRIVAEIISRTTCRQTCQTTGISSLLARGVYDSAFPLHDGSFTRRGRKDQRNDRQLLHEEWANYGVMHKYQPVDLIRKYFGEQIGLYFAWLGVYTQLLIPPSVLGIIVFLYGIFTVDVNVPSQETCDDNLNITMCPLCDGVCDYWRLSTVCSLARASYLFDNGATVLFAIFMSLWAACFLEHWKRRQMCLKHTWDLTSLEDEEERVQEEMRPEYEEALQEKKAKMKAKSKKKLNQTGDGVNGETDRMLASQSEPESLDVEDHLSGYLINVSAILLLIFVTFSAVFGVAVYRICMLSVWSMNPDPEAKASVRMTVTTTGIILNMLVVLVLEEVYGAIAVWLTELELPKTKEEFEERLIFKSFFLKSMNAFAPIFYVAFFKGRFAGRPGDYVYVFGDYRMEECAPPGCLIELCIQLSMIMLGKQLIQNNVFEVLIPKLKKMYRTMQEEKVKKRAAENNEENEEDSRPKQQFDKDFTLEPFEGVSPEYMEMIIQYGFVSLFVASFPLAPAFALLNNVIEIRLDAAKFVTEIRRPDAVRLKDIGIWYNILCGISKFSVITNAFVISFTSEFVPRMVYQYMYSANGTMNGYTEHSLSYFNVSNFPPGTAPTTTLITGVSMCRYKDYRDPPWDPDAYTFSKQYWSVLAAKLAFVIFFQNLAMFLSMLVAWMIPDVPRSLREQLKKENMMLMEFLLNQDQEACGRTHTPRPSISYFPANIDIVVEAPQEEQDEQQMKEEDEAEEIEINLDEPRKNNDSDPEVGRPFEEVVQDGRGGEREGDGGEVEGGEREKDEEVNEEVGRGENEQEGGEEKVDGGKEVTAEEVKAEEVKDEEVKDEEVKADEVKADEVKAEEVKAEEVKAEEVKADEVKADEVKADENFTVDLDFFMGELGLLDEEPLSSTAIELPRSGSRQEYQKDQEHSIQPLPSSKRGSSQSLKSSRADITTSDIDTRLFSLIAPPPPRESGSRAKARCSTLPSRHRGAEACYSLPRPSHSTSLTRFQQAATLTPLVPLGTSVSGSPNPFSPSPFSPPHTPVSPSSPHPPQSPSAQQPKPTSELFALKGPPPQQPRSRGKARCSTLPARQRAPDPEEPTTKPSHSTSFTKLGDRIPPSPSELKRKSPV
ncbi:Anoctamin-1 Discovered on gastrointestinal stromal tumors protein 1 [Larimichthys crocea]|uniref:Anoctamin n=1 Tax=Larimichthys crocea TaxID=215358 RepID=A0A6G0IYE1_LARCR|nr:Anoctamin-1 Discovered on gastrointestinal stromal tumors protein 1 [Larimichthys crocea]